MLGPATGPRHWRGTESRQQPACGTVGIGIEISTSHTRRGTRPHRPGGGDEGTGL